MILLEQIQEFKASPEIRKKLIEYTVSRSFKEGETIVSEDSSFRSVPIVVKGSLKVYRTEEDGREILLYYIKAGESCVMAFLGGIHHKTSKVKAVVEQEAEVLFLPMEKVSLLIKEYPEWLNYIFRLYHTRFEELLEVVNAVTFKKTDTRLMDLLHKKAALTQSRTILITHEQLANELGTSRVVISRLLKQQEEDGTVKLGRNKILLV